MSVLLMALHALLVLQITQPQPYQDSTPPVGGCFETLSRDEYLLGPGDVLNVVVEGGCNDVMLMAGLLPSAICLVSGDGSLQMPGVGQLSVDGLSQMEPGLIGVWISGMVNSPGRYPLQSINRVSDLVLAAGGLAPFGSRWGTMHMPDDSVVEVDLSFGANGQPLDDPYIVSGASVVIHPVSRPVFVLRTGAVHNPGSVLYQSGMTVQQCIDMAGGARNTGRTGQALLSRTGTVLARGGGALAMNTLPGDVIEVPYSVESRYQTSIVTLASLVTMTATIINHTRN